MAKKSLPKESNRYEWDIFYLGNKQKYLGRLEASTEDAAIKAAAIEYLKVPSKLMALRKLT